MQAAQTQTAYTSPGPDQRSVRFSFRWSSRPGSQAKNAAISSVRRMVRMSIDRSSMCCFVGISRRLDYTPLRRALYSFSALAWLMPLTSSRSEMLAALTAATVLKWASRAALVFSPTPGRAVSVAA